MILLLNYFLVQPHHHLLSQTRVFFKTPLINSNHTKTTFPSHQLKQQPFAKRPNHHHLQASHYIKALIHKSPIQHPGQFVASHPLVLNHRHYIALKPATYLDNQLVYTSSILITSPYPIAFKLQ